MAVEQLDVPGARRIYEQHRASHALIQQLVAWVDACPPIPAETPTGQEHLDRWQAALLDLLDALHEGLRRHLEDEEAFEMFAPRHPAFLRFESTLAHLKAEHPLLLASLDRLRHEVAPKLSRVLEQDTHAFLELYEKHEGTENRILGAVYGDALRDVTVTPGATPYASAPAAPGRG